MIIKHAYVEQMGTDPMKLWATDQEKPEKGALINSEEYERLFEKWEKSFKSFPVLSVGDFRMVARNVVNKKHYMIKSFSDFQDIFEKELANGVDIPVEAIFLKSGSRIPDGLSEVFAGIDKTPKKHIQIEVCIDCPYNCHPCPEGCSKITKC